MMGEAVGVHNLNEYLLNFDQLLQQIHMLEQLKRRIACHYRV